MNKIKRFFTDTIPNAFRGTVRLVRNNPMKSAAATVAVFIGGSTLVSAVSSKNYDKASDPSLDNQTSIVQDAEETTSAYTTTATTTATTPVTTEVTTTDSIETGTNVVTADDTEFLSDYFKKYVEKVEFEDNNQPYIIDDEKLLEQNGYIVNDNGTITNVEGYTFDGNGGYITDDVVIEGSYFEAPDGIIYTSRDAYERLNSEADKVDTENHDGEVIDFELIDDRGEYSYIEDGFKIDGNYYIDSDGIVWTSEDAYVEFINPDYDFKGYTDPDGKHWASEQDYLDSLKGYEEVETTEPVVTTPAEETTTEAVQTDEYYKAPDGSRWSSEQDYLDSLQDYIPVEETTEPVVTQPAETQPAETQPAETQPVTEAETEATTTTTVAQSDEPQAPIFTEETPVETEDEYYTAPDGSKWTSKEKYDEWKNDYEEMLALEEEAAQTTTAATTTAVETETITTTVKVEETTEAKEETTTKKPETTTATTTTKKPETTTTTTTTPTEKQDEYYTAPDGSIWASEADYLEFMQDYEVEAQKTR